MNMKIFYILSFGFLLNACAGTVPTEYNSQSYMKIQNKELIIGDFSYQPFEQGKVKSNQIANTAIGSMFIGEDVAEYFKRATGIELTSSGVKIKEKDADFLTGKVIEFEADDLGYSVDWKFTAEYLMKNGDNVIIDKTYSAKERKTGKFGLPFDYTSVINLLMLDVIEQFMNDLKQITKQPGKLDPFR